MASSSNGIHGLPPPPRVNDRTEYVSFRVTPTDVELLQMAANHAHKTVSQFCRDVIFEALDRPDAARHVEVMNSLATICELLVKRPAEPNNPYAGLDLADVEAKLQRMADLELRLNVLKMAELNEYSELRHGLIGSLYGAWKEGGMTRVKLVMSGR